MKKLISVLLTLCLLVTALVPVVAAEKCDCGISPVVSVRGFGSELFVQTDAGEKNVFQYNTEEITSMVAGFSGALTQLALKKDYNGFVEKLKDAVAVLAKYLICDENGDPVIPTVTHSDPTDTDTHKGTDYVYFRKEKAHNNYVFEYDWRVSPIENADRLNDYIKAVKEVTGHDKITLLSHSEGNNITASYFYKYGTDDINCTIHLSAAYQGISIIGEAFTKQVDLADKGDGLQSFLTTVLGDDTVFTFLKSLVTSLNNMGLLNSLLNGLSTVFDKTLDQVYDEILIDTFATMPAMWSFVPDEYYAEAKEIMLGEDPKYGKLIEKIDAYHDNVQTHVPALLQNALDDGVKLAISCGYGISVIPVTTVTDSQGDMLIDTKYASLGATTAPFGGALDSGERLSPDAQIDASTCAFPEYTWFVKYQSHNDFCEPYKAFVLWLIQFEGQPTVSSNEEYPQFLRCVAHQYLKPVEPGDIRTSEGLLITLLQKIISFFKTLFEKLSVSAAAN